MYAHSSANRVRALPVNIEYGVRGSTAVANAIEPVKRLLAPIWLSLMKSQKANKSHPDS